MYANTCWGLLSLAVGFGLAVLGLPIQYEWLSSWLLGAAATCGIGSLICFSWPLRQKENRDRLKEFCAHPYRAAKLIEPHHVIILGLVIALGGVIWQQWRRAPVAMAGLQQPITSYLPTSPTTTAPVTPPPITTTAPADVPKKLAAIDALREILDGDMPPWINKGQQLTTGAWWNWAVSGETVQLKDEVSKFYRRGQEINEKLEHLQKDNVQFPDIHALASSPLGRPYLLKVEKFVTPVLALPDGPLTMGNDLYRFLFEPYAKEAYETTNEVEGWRRTTEQNALQLRRQISQ